MERRIVKVKLITQETLVKVVKLPDCRVCLDPFGGIELDAHGFKKRKWTWKEQLQHVHAPPIQPLTFAITPYISLRIMSQDNITLTYKSLKCSVRFQVGAKLKVSMSFLIYLGS